MRPAWSGPAPPKATATPPLEVATGIMGEAFLASIVEKLCGVEPMIESAAAAPTSIPRRPRS